jgi:hypothetical protein
MIQIMGFTQFQKNTLKGFFTARLSNVGLEVRDLTLHEKNGKRWVALPAKLVQRTPEQGGNSWFAILTFFDKNRERQFQQACMAALDAFLAKGGDAGGF